MIDLQESIKYTTQKKEHQLKKLEESHFKKATEILQSYLDEKKSDALVGSRLEKLSSWQLWLCLNKFIHKKKAEYSSLSKATFYALEANNWEYSIGILSPTYDEGVLFKNATMHLGQMLYLGWVSKAKLYGNLLINMLYGKQYKGGGTTYKYPWFIIDLFCFWQNIKLDASKLRRPENLGVYDEALANWNTTDVQILSTIINKLTDFHIKNSDEYVVTDEYGNEQGAEFSTSDYFIFPVEILAWLAIRKNVGLPVYTPSNNELMEMQINKVPNEIIPYPEDELVQKCKAKLIQDNPGLQFAM